MANVLSTDKQIAVISALAEGSSIRSIERITGVHRDTIMRLGVRVGKGCASLLDAKMRNLSCKQLQFDELWGFIGKKERHCTPDDSLGFGDVWTFCAIDADTKIVPSFKCGKRDSALLLRWQRESNVISRRSVILWRRRCTHIQELREIIRRLHGAEATHVESVAVKETFQGKTVWEGIVEVFDLHGHPKAPRVYAWSHDTGGPKKRHVTVLHVAPITSAVEAVRAAIVQEFRGRGTAEES